MRSLRCNLYQKKGVKNAGENVWKVKRWNNNNNNGVSGVLFFGYNLWLLQRWCDVIVCVQKKMMIYAFLEKDMHML